MSKDTKISVAATNFSDINIDIPTSVAKMDISRNGDICVSFNVGDQRQNHVSVKIPAKLIAEKWPEILKEVSTPLRININKK